MSGPLKLNAKQLDRLAEFLVGLSDLKRKTQISADGYAPLDVEIDGNTLRVGWDKETEQYIVDDRNGT